MPEHPSWRNPNSAGKPTVCWCVSGSEHRQVVRSRRQELVREVGTDGALFGMFHARAEECHREVCRSRLPALTGPAPQVQEDLRALLCQQRVQVKCRKLAEARLGFNRAIRPPQPVLVVDTCNAWAWRAGSSTRNSIRVTDGPPVEVRARSIVQAATHLQPGRAIGQLLNDDSSTGRSQTVNGQSLHTRREVIPISEVKVTSRDLALRRFTLIPGRSPCLRRGPRRACG